jgi:hypothetical protein
VRMIPTIPFCVCLSFGGMFGSACLAAAEPVDITEHTVSVTIFIVSAIFLLGFAWWFRAFFPTDETRRLRNRVDKMEETLIQISSQLGAIQASLDTLPCHDEMRCPTEEQIAKAMNKFHRHS